MDESCTNIRREGSRGRTNDQAPKPPSTGARTPSLLTDPPSDSLFVGVDTSARLSSVDEDVCPRVEDEGGKGIRIARSPFDVDHLSS